MASEMELLVAVLGGVGLFLLAQILMAKHWMPKFIDGASLSIQKTCAKELSKSLKRPVRPDWDSILSAGLEVAISGSNKGAMKKLTASMHSVITRYIQETTGMDPRTIGEYKKKIGAALDEGGPAGLVQALGIDPGLLALAEQLGFETSKIAQWLPLIQNFIGPGAKNITPRPNQASQGLIMASQR